MGASWTLNALSFIVLIGVTVRAGQPTVARITFL
jgi:hypothetical protein